MRPSNDDTHKESNVKEEKQHAKNTSQNMHEENERQKHDSPASQILSYNHVQPRYLEKRPAARAIVRDSNNDNNKSKSYPGVANSIRTDASDKDKRDRDDATNSNRQKFYPYQPKIKKFWRY